MKLCRPLIISAIFLLLWGLGFSLPIFAQTDVLPQGIGAYGIGLRQYMPQTHKYGEDGKREDLGAPFSKDFNGKNLLEGAGGEELKKLAEQLKKFDGNSNSSDSLLNTLNLGRLNVDVKGSIQAQAFGVAYGFLPKFSGFFLVPWVKANVDVNINYDNSNNLNEIRGRLGDLAFEELKAGFDKAAVISTQQVVDSMTNLGYGDPHHWEYQGLGDILAGGLYVNKFRLDRNVEVAHVWRPILSIPTGYYDDPDLLSDVSVGKGYYILINQYSPTVVFSDIAKLSLNLSYGYGFDTEVEKRVPEENESLVAPDRKTMVNLQPGADLGYGIGATYIPYFIRPGYAIGVSQHMKDKYSGSLAGNYDRLAKGTDSYQLYHEFVVTLDTAKLYQEKAFSIPLVTMIRAHIPIQAKNTLDDRFYELALGSFFLTPMARSSASTKKISHQQQRTKNQNQYRNRKLNSLKHRAD